MGERFLTFYRQWGFLNEYIYWREQSGSLQNEVNSLSGVASSGVALRGTNNKIKRRKFMREKLVAFIKYVGAAVVGAVLSWCGLGCVIARSAST